jgi:hypothetical protein
MAMPRVEWEAVVMPEILQRRTRANVEQRAQCMARQLGSKEDLALA